MARSGTPSDHFDGKKFRNLDGAPAGASLWDVLRWKLGSGPVPPWPKWTTEDMVAPKLPEKISLGNMAATFVGHSTFLLQFANGVNVLTDPVWSDHASPVTFAGHRRARPPALAFDEMPPIHAVLVSHGHYDHLDLKTLRRLDERFQPRFIAGLGNRTFLQKRGLRRVEELDWWENLPLTGGGEEWQLTFAPAQHWSARTLTDRNTTLWGSFFLTRQTAEKSARIYFAADSPIGLLRPLGCVAHPQSQNHALPPGLVETLAGLSRPA